MRHLLHNDKLVDHAIDEHSQLKRLLDDLDGKSPDDAGFVNGFAEVQRLVEEHLGEEERDLLPRLGGAATSDERRKMGKHIQTAKKAAPTHSPSACALQAAVQHGAGPDRGAGRQGARHRQEPRRGVTPCRPDRRMPGHGARA